jgi:hypothetical protein
MNYSISISQILLFVMVLAFFGCKEISQPNDDFVNVQKLAISNITTTDTTNLSEIFEIENLILCKFPDGVFIGYIDDIKQSQGYTYILDLFVSKSIFGFDPQGNFLFQINDIGEGPGQFQNLRDFTISHNQNELLVSVDKHGLYVYDAFTGVFKNEIKLNFVPRAIGKTPFGYAMVGNNSKIHLLSITDKNFQLKYTAVNRDFRATQVPLKYFSELPGKTLFVNSYDNKNYHIKEDGLYPYRQIEGTEMSLIMDEVKQSLESNSKLFDFENRIKNLRKTFSHLEFSDGVFFVMYDGLLEPSYHITSLKSGETFHLLQSKINDDLFFSGLAFFNPIGVTDKGNFLGFVHARHSKDFIYKNLGNLAESPQLGYLKPYL